MSCCSGPVDSVLGGLAARRIKGGELTWIPSLVRNAASTSSLGSKVDNNTNRAVRDAFFAQHTIG